MLMKVWLINAHNNLTLRFWKSADMGAKIYKQPIMTILLNEESGIDAY